MNLLDANSVVSTLGLIGVLGIIFMETGLLIGLVFPGGEVVFLAGIAASGSGAAALGDAKLSTPLSLKNKCKSDGYTQEFQKIKIKLS